MYTFMQFGIQMVEDNDAGNISDWTYATCGTNETFPTAG